jgi:hypothetical protein
MNRNLTARLLAVLGCLPLLAACAGTPVAPAAAPTVAPAVAPAAAPAAPTPAPTAVPTAAPTAAPTSLPTAAPTALPDIPADFTRDDLLGTWTTFDSETGGAVYLTFAADGTVLGRAGPERAISFKTAYELEGAVLTLREPAGACAGLPGFYEVVLGNGRLRFVLIDDPCEPRRVDMKRLSGWKRLPEEGGAASPTAAAVALDQLMGPWTRYSATDGAPIYLIFGTEGRLRGAIGPDIPSSATAFVGTYTLKDSVLALTDDDVSCDGTVGTYRAELLVGGQYLLLTAVEDACPGRAGDIGTRWTRYAP